MSIAYFSGKGGHTLSRHFFLIKISLRPQNEAKVQTLTESLLMAEKKKRDATEELDELRDLLSQLKSQEKVRDVSAHDREREKEQALLIRVCERGELELSRL